MLSADQPKNQNRNMSGVPEWSQAEMDSVMRLYEERGRMPRWKPIADDLARLNANGELNSALSHKGLVRSNNAVMNKVKEILYKEHGDVPGRVRYHCYCYPLHGHGMFAAYDNANHAICSMRATVTPPQNVTHLASLNGTKQRSTASWSCGTSMAGSQNGSRSLLNWRS